MQKVELRPLADTRPSLCDLWNKHKFHSGMLTIKAKVPPGTVQAMLRNQPVAREHAEKILAALSELVHKDYTLQSVSTVTTEEEYP
jgi:hypothetical protein